MGEWQYKPVGFRALLDYISNGSEVVNIQVMNQAEVFLHVRQEGIQMVWMSDAVGEVGLIGRGLS